MEFLRISFLLACINPIFPYDSTNDYLDEKLGQSKIEVTKLHFQDDPPVQKKLYNVQWDQVWQENLDKGRPFIANMDDKVLLIEENRFLTYSPNETPPNRTLYQTITPPVNSNSVKFVKSIVWKDTLYLLVCYTIGSCEVYTGGNYSQLLHRQTIQHKGNPTDASMFIHSNQLYLVVAYNSGQFAVPSLLYQWRGTYMDVMTEIMTIAAVSVITFQHKQSIIIVFAQNDGNSPGIGSMVYEFEGTIPYQIQFLPTSNPKFLHHYDHDGFNLILILNEYGPAYLYWWDGHELLHWQYIEEIQSPNLAHIINIHDDIFFLVAYTDRLELYNFENAADYTLLSFMKLPNEMTLIDAKIKVENSTIMIVLITMNKDDIYSMISWELHIEEIPSEQSIKESDALSKDFAELIDLLQRRKWLVDQAESSGTLFLPANENVTISGPIVLPNFSLDSGTIGNIEIYADEDILPPLKLQELIKRLEKEVDEVLELSKKLFTLNNGNSLNANIVVNGDAIVEDLEIDKLQLDYINGHEIRSSDEIDGRIGAESSKVLKGKEIVVHDLKIDAICGIPFQFWSLNNNDSSKIEIDLYSDEIELKNDTVYVNSNLMLKNISVKKLNDTNIEELFDELFIIDRNQKITGNLTYTNTLQIHNLTTEFLNDLPMDRHMNTLTDQNFDNFAIKSIHVKNLYADFVNGVPFSEIARISQKNAVKGEVKVAELLIRDEFIVDSDFILPEMQQQHQIYNNVTIFGNVRIGTLDLEKSSEITIKDEELSLNDILENFWTKSTDQLIENDVIFEKDVIIDHLNTKYLNGHEKHEYLYTSATTIPETFKNLHFQNVQIEDTFFLEGNNYSLFEIAPESITIHEKVSFDQFHAKHLLINTFNGLQVDDILSGKISENSKKIVNLFTIRSDEIVVKNLNFSFFNNESSHTLTQRFQNPEKNERTEYLKVPNFHVNYLNVEQINDLEMEKLQLLKTVNLSSILKNVEIEGDLIVKDDLKIDWIDDQTPEKYFENLIKKDVAFDGKMAFEELIVENISVKSLNDFDVNDLFPSLLSRSKKQNVHGKFSFYKITADNVDAKLINDRNTSDILWIDDPVNLSGNVTFENLFVNGDLVTDTLNDQDVNEFYQNLLNISATRIANLKIDGNISWDNPSKNFNTWTYLFENAVTKNTNQTVIGDVTFHKDVSASRIIGKWEEIDEICDIITDAVMDDEDVIEISGRKTFKNDLETDDLFVTGDINIPKINGIDIVRFNDSVVRKGQTKVIDGSINFLEDVTINQIFVDDDKHNVPLKEAVLVTDMLPSNVLFKKLEITDAYLKNLDGIDFDEFVKNRISIDTDQKILADIIFDDIVHVTGNAGVFRINEIDPLDFVLNGSTETQVITGPKIFKDHVIIDGNVNSPFVNGVNISSEYLDGIQNDEDVEIIGDLVFETKVGISNDLTVSNLINGINLQNTFNNLQDGTYGTLETVKRNENEIEEKITRSSSITEHLKNVFSYLEEEDRLKIHVKNVKEVQVVYYEHMTKLNMFGEESGSICGLSDNCTCPFEYVAELDEEGYRINRINGSKIVRNYREFHGKYGVNIAINTVSYNSQCTLKDNAMENVKISWMSSEIMETEDMMANFKKRIVETRGFVKDAEVFMMPDDSAYVVLAVYYDAELGTHRTDSLVYKINFEENVAKLNQKLPTDSAWSVEVFKINHQKVYLLIGCFGESEESFLYELDEITSQFSPLRTFYGKSRNTKALHEEDDHFLLIDDFHTNAVNVFHYDAEFNNFYSYQSLFHDSRIVDVECFYADEAGHSDSFVIVTTENDHFYIYEYMYAQKFQLKMQHRIDDLQGMVPFYYQDNHYIFTGTGGNSTILRIVKQGPH